MNNKFLLFTILFLSIILANSQDMYIIKSGEIAAQYNYDTEVDSLVFYNESLVAQDSIYVMKGGLISDKFDVYTDLDSIIFYNPVLGKELVKNGDFSLGQTPWSFVLDSGAIATGSEVGGEFVTDITSSTTDWWILLGQANIPIKQGSVYWLRLDAKCTSPSGKSIKAIIRENANNFTWYTERDFWISDTMKTYEYVFTSSVTDPIAQLGFQLGGDNTGVTIDNVSLVEIPNESYVLPSVIPVSSSATAGLDNILLYAPVMSSTNGENNVVTAVNDNLDTPWTAPIFPAYAEFDLGNLNTMSELDIFPTDGVAYQFRLETKANLNDPYTVVLDETANTTGGVSVFRTFPEVTARYVRLTITGVGSGNVTSVSLDEVRLFGTAPKSPFPNGPLPWRPEYEEIAAQVSAFTFTHPMTVINATELNELKTRISGGLEPQASAYVKLITRADDALNFVPSAPATIYVPGGYLDNTAYRLARDIMKAHSKPAYDAALAYAITGNTAYADKAVELLNYLPQNGIVFTGDTRALLLGWHFTPLLYATDLLHDYSGWSSVDRQAFKDYWYANILRDGQVIDYMRWQDNNWKDATTLHVFAAAVVFEDHDLLHEALTQLKSYFFTRVDSNVNIKGSFWKIRKDNLGVMLPRETERSSGTAGVGYTAIALTTMVQSLEIARYAGFDFWNMQTEQGARVQELIEQWYDWRIANEPYVYWDWILDVVRFANFTGGGNHYNILEVANDRYTLRADIKDWIAAPGNRPFNLSFGDEHTSLNKGR